MKKLRFILCVAAVAIGGGVLCSCSEEHMHAYGEWIVTSPATCAEFGEMQRVCECGEVETMPIAPTGIHEYGDWAVTTAPTCTDEGLEERICSKCDHAETRAVAKVEHNYGDLQTMPSTCTEKGYTYQVCSVCEREEKTEELPFAAHTPSDWIVDIAATCLGQGSKHTECTACKTILEIQTITALEHNYIVQTTAPTCEKFGYDTHTCEKCGDTYIDNYISALGHIYGDWIEKTAPTCTDEGLEERICSKCDHAETRAVAKIEHNYGEWKLTRPSNDCGDIGEMARTCTECGRIDTAPVAPTDDHIFGEWETEIPATCTQEGVSLRVCERCNKTERRKIAALGHTFETWLYNDAEHWKLCSVCHESYDRAAHEYNTDNICTICDFYYHYTTGIEYELYPDGKSYLVKSVGTATDTDIVIPSEYNGLPVTYIGPDSFAYCKVTSIVLPNTIEKIGARAFQYCSNLKTFIIPNSVTSIGYSAFSGCSGLTSIVIPKSVTSIRNSAFDGCDKVLSTVGNCKVVDDFAFGIVDRSISIVSVPNGVTRIGDFAFAGCNELTSVVVSDSVTSIGDFAFAGCSGLTSVVIPNSVTSIRNYAFHNCSGLTSVIIPDSVTSIGGYAFYGCYGLTSVTIGNSVTSIGYCAFCYCDGLNEVFYSGTADDWVQITIGSNNDILTSASRYYYSETEPPMNSNGTAYDGNYWHCVDGVVTKWIREA